VGCGCNSLSCLVSESLLKQPSICVTGAGRQATQARHRLRMLFPLLLSISSRLAQTVTMALATMVATFVMAVLAKKAFLISLAAFGLMLHVTFKKNKKKYHIVHSFVEPSRKKRTIDSHYITSEPAYPYEGTDTHWKKYYSSRSVYEDGSSNIVQNIQRQPSGSKGPTQTRK